MIFSGQNFELFQKFHIGIVVHAPDSRVLFSNHRASELLGLSIEQMIGKDAIDPTWCFVDEDERDMPADHYPISRVLATREPLKDLVVGIKWSTQAQPVWVLVNGFPEFDATGALQHVVVNFFDITDRKQAELKLRKSEALNRTILDSLAANIAVIDSKGSIVQVNESWRKFGGGGTAPTDTQDSIGLNYLDVCGGNGAYVDQTAMQSAEGLRSVLRGELSSFQLEYPCNSPTQDLWFRMSVTPMTGEIGGAVVSHEDITASREAQEAVRISKVQLQAILAGIPIAVFVKDANSRFVLMNEVCEKQWGLSLGDLQGTDGSQFFPADQMEGFLAADKAVFDGGRAISFEELVWSSGLQKNLNVHTFKNPVYDQDGKPQYLVCATLDITERKVAQSSLEKSLKETEALLREVHHRVKNNLQVITSLLRLESRRSTVGDTKTVLGEMQSRISTMALLHESLYRTGTFASVDLGSYLRQVCTQAFQSQSTRSGEVQLVLNLGSVQVGMDQAISCGLLINELISNSLKHGFPAGVSGLVSIDLQPQDGANHWRLRVSDTGVGLPENFEDKRKNSLGLQLAGDLARQIGGTLEITPNQDKGAVFTVNFRTIDAVSLVMPV